MQDHSPEARLAQARAHAHLRQDLDFDTVLRILHERSATLAPVEPHFHPDVALLLSRVVDVSPFTGASTGLPNSTPGGRPIQTSGVLRMPPCLQMWRTQSALVSTTDPSRNASSR